MDLNLVMLQGKIGNDLQYKKTQDGAVFATFTVIVSTFNKEFKDRTEQRNDVFIRIMCFDKRLVEYLQKVNAKQGNRINVFARLNTHKSEYKGIALVQTDVIARDLTIIKVKDLDAPQTEIQGNGNDAPNANNSDVNF